MKIEKVEAVAVSVPLTRPYHIARGIMHAFPSVIVRITTDDGLVGYGESVPLSVVGDVAPIAARINTVAADVLRNRSPFDIEDALADVLSAVEHDLDILGGIDLALWDLMGKALKMPVYKLMGGACNTPILVDYTLGSLDAGPMADQAQQMVDSGYTGLVVKATGDIEKDIQKTRAIRERVGRGIKLRIDCNTGFKLESALRFLEGVKRFDIEFVEQPIAADNLIGLRKCREVGIPISVDESLNTRTEAMALISEKACDVFNIKVPKVGGLTLAKKIAAIGEAAGMPIVVGGRTTLELSRYASRHFAASTPGTKGRAHEGPGPASQALADDITTVRSTYDTIKRYGSRIPVETGPGLGAEVVWEKVEQYRMS
jgi:L-alanine-DL-glutamate epimerase-like enolase superfamily enzyme